MNILDVTILILLGVGFLLGLAIGVARVVCALGALIASVFCALQFNGPAADLLAGLIASESLRRTVAFAAIFLAVLCAGSVAAWGARRFLRIVRLGWLDRTVGALAGGTGALLLSTLIVLVLAALAPKGTRLLAESRIAPLCLRATEVMVTLVPDDLRRRIVAQRETIREKIEEEAPKILDDAGKGPAAQPDRKRP